MLRQPLPLLTGVLLLLLLLTIPSAVVALLSRTTISNRPTKRPSPSSSALLSHRVFVGGLTTACDRLRLQETLETRYGPIQNIILSKRRRRPYAFVDFRDKTDAARAIAAENSEEELYRTIEAVASSPTPNNKLSPAQQEEERKVVQLDYEEKLIMAQTSTAIIQVGETHINRLQKFLHGRDIGVKANMATITRTCRKTSCRSVGLLGVNFGDASQLQPWFQSLPFPLLGVNKIYAVQHQVIGTTLQALQQCVQMMTSSDNKNGATLPPLWKLNVFPPSGLPQMLKHLQENHPELESQLSPQNFTHTMHLVHIPTLDTDYNRQVWSLGIEERGGEAVGDDRSNNKNETNRAAKTQTAIISNQANAKLICRAQSKLQEAFFRYTAGPFPDCIMRSSDTSSNNKENEIEGGGVAIDCGAAPGGWTQFMVDHTNCDLIYSIDPGELDPSVTKHSNVIHMQSKAEDAMSRIQNVFREGEHASSNSRGHYAKLWVSDMCLHQMSDQVDIFLNALRIGVVGEGTFMVLTLKCRVGHSDEAFDGQVAIQRERLEESCQNLETIHLFSNRRGERTIMGYVKDSAATHCG